MDSIKSSIYRLNGEKLPTIPSPHDCVIEKIELTDEYLIFKFKNNFTFQDFVKKINIDAKGLTIKFHLTDAISAYKSKIRKIPKFRQIYIEIPFEKIIKSAKNSKIEYLYYNIGYQSIILQLWNRANIILDISVDYIEYIWDIEQSSL